MRRRRGRARKAGTRERNGRVQRRPAETPRQVAAAMPHRKGLGELAVDQRAETELGRLVLRGQLDATQGLAGETYLALWRGYVMSLAGPQQLGAGGGHGFSCAGCEQMRHCRCEFRKRIWLEAYRVLQALGLGVVFVVNAAVLHGWSPATEAEFNLLRAGLGELARHFGLTPRANSSSQKISIPNHVA